MWPFSTMSLAAASIWNNAANLGLLGSAILLFIATFVLWQTADQKEHLWESERSEANLKIAELNNETAKAKLETERLKLRFAWRTISKDQQSKIVLKLKKFAGQKFEIVTYASDLEAANYGALINQTLSDAGWVYVRNSFLNDRWLNGAFAESAPGPIVDIASQMVRAMNEENVPINQGTYPTLYIGREDTVFIAVGVKPPLIEDVQPRN